MDLKSFLLALLEFFDKVPRFEPVCTDSKYGGYNITFPVKKIQYKVCNSKTIKGGLILEYIKVHIFWEGHKILRNLPLTFDYSTNRQKLGEDFAKFCGLLRIYEL